MVYEVRRAKRVIEELDRVFLSSLVQKVLEKRLEGLERR